MQGRTIILRPLKFRDFSDYFQLTHSDPDIKLYIPGIVQDTKAKAGEFLGYYNADYESEYAYMIEWHSNTGIYPVGALFASAETIYYDCLNVTFFIAKEYRGRGYMKEALANFSAFLSGTRYKSLLFDVQKDNIPSKRLLQRIGAIYTGTITVSIFEFERFELKI